MSIPCLTDGEAYRVKTLVYLNGALGALTKKRVLDADIEKAQKFIDSAKSVIDTWLLENNNSASQ